MSNENILQLLENATGPLPVRLTNDYLFKALLQRSKTVLKALVCSLLHQDLSYIDDLDITNPILPGEAVGDKNIALDVNILLSNGSILDLEMQVVNEQNWPERSLYYNCRNFTRLDSGEPYDLVKPSFHIGFLDFTLFKDHPVFYASYLLRDEMGYLYTDKFSIGVVDLSRIALATDADRQYNIDKWALLFKAQSWEDIKMLAKEDTNIQAAAATVFQLTEDDRIRQQYEAREDHLRRERGMARRLANVDSLEKQVAEDKKQLAEKDELIAEKDGQLAVKDEQLAKYQKLYGPLPEDAGKQ